MVSRCHLLGTPIRPFCSGFTRRPRSLSVSVCLRGSTVNLWWALYLGMGLAAIPMLVAAFFSTTVAVLLVVVPGTMTVAAALAARRMIPDVGRTFSS
jgi:hypothetical protein